MPPAHMKYAWSALIFIAFAGGLIGLTWYERSSSEDSARRQALESADWGAGQASPFSSASPSYRAGAPEASRADDAALIQLSQTSLAGTQADGQWGADANGRLRIDFSLRQRIDYFLTLLGEQPLDRVRSLVHGSASKELPAAALQELMQLWDRYVALQQHRFQTSVDLSQPGAWSAALLERQTVRRQILGADVAYAFYAQEERELQQMMARAQSASVAPAEQSVPIALHPEATQREAQLEREWSQWQQRIDQARAEMLRLQNAPELSAPQRQNALAAMLVSQFPLDSERLRAAALLGL
jgi:lipase chaperone LimK